MDEMAIMTPAEIIERIGAFGFDCFVGPDGVVHGRPSKPGTKVPIEMHPVLDQLRLQNDAVAEVIRSRDRVVHLQGLTREQFAPWKARCEAGEFIPKECTYVRSTGLIYCTLERRDGNG